MNVETDDISKLLSITTVIKAFDERKRTYVLGSKYDRSRFERNHGQQICLQELESFWNKKWSSFGKVWSLKRQMYRFLYDSFRLFYYSFTQLVLNKHRSINASAEDPAKQIFFNDLTAVGVYGMYFNGKKTIDIIRDIGVSLNSEDDNFFKKFAESRNKFFEHNFNPRGLESKIEPSLWSLINTDSLIEIIIHGSKEHEYSVYVDYYEDYYKLEETFSRIIKNFSI